MSFRFQEEAASQRDFNEAEAFRIARQERLNPAEKKENLSDFRSRLISNGKDSGMNPSNFR